MTLHPRSPGGPTCLQLLPKHHSEVVLLEEQKNVAEIRAKARVRHESYRREQ